MINQILLTMVILAVRRLVQSDVFDMVVDYCESYALKPIAGEEKRAYVQRDMREWLRRRARELPGVLINLAIEAAVLKLKNQ